MVLTSLPFIFLIHALHSKLKRDARVVSQTPVDAKCLVLRSQGCRNHGALIYNIQVGSSTRLGQSACEVTFFYYEDMGISWEIAKFGIGTKSSENHLAEEDEEGDMAETQVAVTQEKRALFVLHHRPDPPPRVSCTIVDLHRRLALQPPVPIDQGCRWLHNPRNFFKILHFDIFNLFIEIRWKD
ncbi:hypothetical protein L2E82_17011 [Cichorium intybus]|uniref:Uncharacterized protein n=1 Tax=Cichorium intybus TaxID=13427 RepID=A0ACB9F8E9_CICIN|nr:hypothetical protein L2E82_17011 [Cichorium intybus]